MTWLDQGWGFCHQACDSKYQIFSNKLKKVRLTTLADDLCKRLGTVEADNLGNQFAVNTRKELCGAFVNKMNLTFVNYTLGRNKLSGKNKKS